MRKFALLLTFALASHLSAVSQDSTHTYGGTSSFGISATYSPDSTHILIGDAGQRSIWTLGGEYTHRLHQTPHTRLDYEGSVTPLFEENDPTFIGTEFTTGGQLVVESQTPVRITHTQSAPIGTVLTASGVVPLYGVFGTQNTYGAALSPLGARISAMPRWKLQPTFGLDLGFVVTARDIPMDDCSQFNFTFAFGPGVQFFNSAHTSIRAEYIYRHISNAGLGAQNPGIDQGVVRLTVSLHR